MLADDNSLNKQMDTFTYSPEEAIHQGYMRALPIIVVLTFAVIALLAGTYFVVPGISIDNFVSSCLMTIVIAGAIGFLSIRSIVKSIQSLQIIIDADRITKTQRGSNSITISKSQVSHIVDVPDRGLRIESLIPGDLIFIPKELASFEKVKAIIFQWQPPTVESNRLPLILLTALGSITLCGLLMIMKSTRVYGFALFFLCMLISLVASAVQAVQRFFIRRRPNKV